MCVNFRTLALLVPEIQRGGEGFKEPPPQSQIDQKKPSLNRVKLPEIVLSKTTKGKYKGGIRNVG